MEAFQFSWVEPKDSEFVQVRKSSSSSHSITMATNDTRAPKAIAYTFFWKEEKCSKAFGRNNLWIFVTGGRSSDQAVDRLQ